MKQLPMLLLLVLALAGAVAQGCTLGMQGPVCEGFWQVSNVFEGAVTDISLRPDKTQPGSRDESIFNSVLVRFAVAKSYRGNISDEVVVVTGRGGGDCGYGFQRGERYLVYADVNAETKELRTSIATLTKRSADAAEDLAYIHALPTEPAGTRLYGSVPDFTRTSEGTRLSQDSLPGADIHLSGPGGVRHLTSDKDGKFEWKGLPSGKYQIGVIIPNYLSFLSRDIDLDLPGRGCMEIRLPVESNGQIEGQVSDDRGNPLPQLGVALTNSEGHGMGEFRTITDDHGHYAFTGVRPGDFLIAVNLSDPPSTQNPYFRTYFPNT